jgi:hypothetical protein
MEYLRQNEIRDVPLILVKAQSVVAMKVNTQRFCARRAGARPIHGFLDKGIVSC